MISGNVLAWAGFGIIVGGTLYDWFSYQTIKVTTAGSRIVFWGGALMVLSGSLMMLYEKRNKAQHFATSNDLYFDTTPPEAVIDEMAGLGLDA